MSTLPDKFDCSMWRPLVYKLEAESWNKLENVSWTVEREELESWS